MGSEECRVSNGSRPTVFSDLMGTGRVAIYPRRFVKKRLLQTMKRTLLAWSKNFRIRTVNKLSTLNRVQSSSSWKSKWLPSTAALRTPAIAQRSNDSKLIQKQQKVPKAEKSVLFPEKRVTAVGSVEIVLLLKKKAATNMCIFTRAKIKLLDIKRKIFVVMLSKSTGCSS